MRFPGDLTDEERQQAFEKMRAEAVERWGEQRAQAIENSLKDASAAVASLDRLRFSRDEAPGFYLHETAHFDPDVPEAGHSL